jgi:hypothetical protein
MDGYGGRTLAVGDVVVDNAASHHGYGPVEICFKVKREEK